MIFDFKGERVAITSLYPDPNSEPTHIRVAAGVYEERWGRNEWTGKSYAGKVPYLAFLEWAIAAGFVKQEGPRP
jgi:hypothetical protein